MTHINWNDAYGYEHLDWGKHTMDENLGTILGTDKNGKVKRRIVVTGYMKLSWDKLVNLYPKGEGKKGEPDPVIMMPLKHIMVKKTKKWRKTPLLCGLQATRDYLEAILGVKLSKEDKSFYEDHPLLEEDGLPTASTLRVVQEMVDPYGLRISRVRVQQGLHLTGDLKLWRKILGVNPMALTDKDSTNLDAANAHRYDGHDLLHLRVAQRLDRHWHASARITNLGNERYAERADFAFGNYRYFPGAERALFLAIESRRD